MSAKLIDWLQVLSNVGILIGLLLVGLQLKQASEIATAQLAGDNLAATMGATEMLAGDELLTVAWSKASQNSPDLSDAELTAIGYFLQREATSAYRLTVLPLLGFKVGPDEGTINKWVYNYLGNDTALRWWHSEANGIRMFNRTLYDAIEVGLSARGRDHRTFHSRVLSEMRGSAPQEPPTTREPE